MVQATDFYSAEEYYSALEERVANPSEARAEYAHNAGAMDTGREWILTPWDTWEHNPCYHGLKGPHPEDDSFWQMSEAEQAAYIAALNAPPSPAPKADPLDFPF